MASVLKPAPQMMSLCGFCASAWMRFISTPVPPETCDTLMPGSDFFNAARAVSMVAGLLEVYITAVWAAAARLSEASAAVSRPRASVLEQAGIFIQILQGLGTAQTSLADQRHSTS